MKAARDVEFRWVLSCNDSAFAFAFESASPSLSGCVLTSVVGIDVSYQAGPGLDYEDGLGVWVALEQRISLNIFHMVQ